MLHSHTCSSLSWHAANPLHKPWSLPDPHVPWLGLPGLQA